MSGRKRFLAAALSIAFSLSLAQVQPIYGKQTPWDAHIKAGQEALRAGNYPEARQQLDQALTDTHTFQSKDPRLGDTYFCLGELNSNDQNYAEAKQYYERALEVQQQTPGIDELKIADTLYGLATASEMMGDRDLAVILLKRVKEIWTRKYGPTSPQLTKVLKSLGIYATVATDFRSAEQFYRELLQLEERTTGADSTQTASALNLLSMTITRTGRYGESAPLAERAVRILGNSPDYRSLYEQAVDNLAFIDHQLGKPMPNIDTGNGGNDAGETAVAEATPPQTPTAVAEKPAAQPTQTSKPALTMAPQVQAQYPLEKSNGGLTTLTGGKLPAGDQKQTKPADGTAVAGKPQTNGQTTTQIAAVPPSSGAVQLNVTKNVLRAPSTAAVTTSGEDFRPWELKDNKLAAATPVAKPPSTNWGKIRYLAAGRLITAEEYQAMLLANDAYELIRQQKYKMACDVLQKALNICPDLASAHTNMGLALSELGDKQGAIEHLKQAIALDPNKSAPWVNLASAFQLNGQLRASLVTYAEFVKRFPTHGLKDKAQELVAHLTKEVQEQTAVEQSLGASRIASLQDYLAFASHSGEMRWSPGQTVRVYVESATNVPGYKPEYDGFAQEAFKQWASASNGRVNFDFVKKADNADIDWHWTNDLSKVSSVAEGGETSVSSSGKQIKHATVTVLTANASVDSPLSPNQVRAVCLHEIGHAVGLVGHSPKPNDIMFCSMPPATLRPSLSQRDVGTIQRLYSQDTTIGFLQSGKKG